MPCAGQAGPASPVRQRRAAERRQHPVWPWLRNRTPYTREILGMSFAQLSVTRAPEEDRCAR